MTVGKSYKVQRTNYRHGYGKEKELNTVPAWGRCIWIHPEGRYAVLEFPDGIRECFPLKGGAE